MTRIEQTALAMLAAFAAEPGYKYTAGEMRDAIREHGGEPDYLQQAAKHLRDRGIRVDATKAREHSVWWLASSSEELETYQRRILNEFYSEASTVARMTHGTSVQDDTLRNAILIGGLLGYSVTEVVNSCAPREMSEEVVSQN